MAAEAPLFVAAEQAGREQVNRLLIHLRDWEYGSGDRFSLIMTRDPAAAISTAITSPPVDQFINSSNTWRGAPLSEIEAFVNSTFPNRRLFIFLDDEGLRTHQCVIVAPSFDQETGDPVANEFLKIRVPWHEAYIVWTNLDLANMDFEDFTSGERLPGGWYEYVYQTGRDPDDRATWMDERDAMLEELEREGRL